MPNLLKRCSQSVLLAGFIAGSILISFAQTPSAPAASQPAPEGSTAAAAGKTASPLATPKEKLSYAIGVDVGNHLKAAAVDIDPTILARGVTDTLTGAKQIMTEEELRTTMAEFQNQLRQKRMAMA